MIRLFALLTLLSFSQISQGAPVGKIEELIKQELSGQGTPLIDLREFAQKHHFVLIGGIVTQNQPHYFLDTETTLKESLESSVSRVFPPSSKTVRESAKFVCSELRLIAEQVKKPLIIIAHSKGGADLFTCLITEPLIQTEAQIEAAILVQATLWGSPVAEVLGSVLKMPGLSSIGVLEMTELMHELLREFALYDPTTQKQLQKTIFYVRSAIDQTPVSQALRLSYRYLKNQPDHSPHALGARPRGWLRDFYNNPSTQLNDGLVLTKDQWVETIGQDFGIADADHADFFSVEPVSNSTKEYREAFTRAVISARLQIKP